MHKPFPTGVARTRVEVRVTEVLPWLPPVGITGFVIAVLYAILRGSLVPRGSVDARITELQQVVLLWKDAAAAKEEVVAEMLPLVRQGLDNDKLTIALVSALKEAVDKLEPGTRSRRGGEGE
jgi:hypothetical protein